MAETGWLTLGLLAATAHGAIGDRRISLAQAQAVADQLARDSGFRVPVDATVLAQVNQIVGRPEARAAFAAGLGRLPRYRAVIEEALARHGIPLPLLAIPQAESRFQAWPAGANPARAAGVWQLIPTTGRRFGLRVDDQIDERLDPAREAEAATSYLAACHEALGDWPPAIAAYNNGLRRVSAAVDATGTRDVGALVASGRISGYVSDVLATALVMQAPRWLE